MGAETPESCASDGRSCPANRKAAAVTVGAMGWHGSGSRSPRVASGPPMQIHAAQSKAAERR